MTSSTVVDDNIIWQQFVINSDPLSLRPPVLSTVSQWAPTTKILIKKCVKDGHKICVNEGHDYVFKTMIMTELSWWWLTPTMHCNGCFSDAVWFRPIFFGCPSLSRQQADQVGPGWKPIGMLVIIVIINNFIIIMIIYLNDLQYCGTAPAWNSEPLWGNQGSQAFLHKKQSFKIFLCDWKLSCMLCQEIQSMDSMII